MKDNFSAQAKDYSTFRPTYPPEMIEYIVSFVKDKNTALDVATGNGQVAKELAKYFKQVYATDMSGKQIENAEKADNITYKVEQAEKTGFDDNQFDLITVAQAIHWFDFDAFYKEVKRLLKPGGIIAVLGYGLFQTNEHSHKILSHFYHDIVGPYWDAERCYLDENYETIPFPFDEFEVKKFEANFNWSIEQLTGYLETWSAVQHYKKKNNAENPVDLIREELKESWEKSDKQVTFPLLLRVGRPLTPEGGTTNPKP
jgi:SAM-dependent methyltransferase